MENRDKQFREDVEYLLRLLKRVEYLENKAKEQLDQISSLEDENRKLKYEYPDSKRKRDKPSLGHDCPNATKKEWLPKPCPFCGDDMQLYYSSRNKKYYVNHLHKQSKARTCVLITPMIVFGEFESLLDATKAWNRRV